MAKQQKRVTKPATRPARRTRTPKKWSAEQIAEILEMARAQATDQTIADCFGADPDTFKKEFRLKTRQARAQGRMVVLQSQFDKASKGDTVSMIWWGKQHLGQSDRKDLDVNASITPALPKTVEEADAQIAAMQKHKLSLQALVADAHSLEKEFSAGED